MSDVRPNNVSSSFVNTTAAGNGTNKHETFRKFFECWIVEQNRYLEQLISASTDYQSATNNESADHVEERVVRPLVCRVLEHYLHYYRAKSRWAKLNVLSILSPSWRSTLENAFLWIGGWRPSMAFHLLYSKSGLQFEDHLQELILGLSTGDLGDLSAAQLVQVDELQKSTLREEREITEKMAKRQETIADSSMVELSHVVSEIIRNTGEEGGEEERVVAILESKVEGLEEVLQEADDLRLKTLKGVIEILTPIQSVHFLIAAAELHLQLHDWGMKKDAREHSHDVSP